MKALKAHVRMFVFWLPGTVALVLAGWLVLGALPQVRLTDDLIAWLAQLPVVTAYALAAVGVAHMVMDLTGQNIDNARRAELMRRAQDGDIGAHRALQQEARAWLALLALFGLFFFPHW